MPDGLNTYKSTLTGPELDAALRNIGLVEQNIAAAAASAEAAANSAEDAKIAAQQAGGFRTFFSAISPNEAGTVDPSRPMNTPTAQPSWTIKSKGDRIQSVQVNIGSIQMKNVIHYVANESDLIKVQNLGATTRFQFAISPMTTANAAGGYANRFLVKDGFLLDEPHAYAYNTSAYFFIPNDTIQNAGSLDLEQAKSFISSQRSKGIVYEIWATTNNTSPVNLFIPIILIGHEYRCQCLPITEALGDGDDVQSNVLSGCNMGIVLDGSEGWKQNGPFGAYNLALDDFPLASENLKVLTSYLIQHPATDTYNGTTGFSRINSARQIQVCLPGKAAPSEYLPTHPLYVTYATAAYTKLVDKNCELETHADGNVYAHPAVDLAAVPYTSEDTGHTPGTYDLSSQNGTTVQVSLKAMQDGGNAATLDGHTWADIQKLISDAVTSAVALSK